MIKKEHSITQNRWNTNIYSINFKIHSVFTQCRCGRHQMTVRDGLFFFSLSFFPSDYSAWNSMCVPRIHIRWKKKKKNLIDRKSIVVVLLHKVVLIFTTSHTLTYSRPDTTLLSFSFFTVRSIYLRLKLP